MSKHGLSITQGEGCQALRFSTLGASLAPRLRSPHRSLLASEFGFSYPQRLRSQHRSLPAFEFGFSYPPRLRSPWETYVA